LNPGRMLPKHTYYRYTTPRRQPRLRRWLNSWPEAASPSAMA